MGAYLTINDNIGDMLKELVKNEIIEKLLSNSKSSAYTDDLPVDFNGLDLLNEKIYDIPKMPDPETESGAFIVAYFNDADFAGKNNTNQFNMIVDVIVVIHNDSWLLDKGKKRPLLLLSEIDRILRDTKTDSIRGHWQPYKPASLIPINESFKGYITKWVITNISNKDCD